MIRITILISAWLLIGCHSNKSTSKNLGDQNTPPIDQLANDKFGDNYFIDENSDGKYSLVKSKTKTFKEIGFDISYFVYDHTINKILIEDSLKSGYVEWEDKHHIKAINRKVEPNKTRTKEVYIFNVITLERQYQP